MWTTPRTYTTVESITASILNVDVRDNLTYLYSTPFARAHHNANQSTGDQGARVVDLNTTEFDTDDIRVIASDTAPLPATAFFRINTAGRYLVNAGATFARGTIAGGRVLAIGHGTDDFDIVAVDANPIAGITTNCHLDATTIIDADVDDGVLLLAQAVGPDEVDILATGTSSPAMSVLWLGN